MLPKLKAASVFNTLQGKLADKRTSGIVETPTII